jgi:hypothetical protein
MPSESDQQNFLARRVLNRRPRYYNLTVPQMGALASALAIGAALWWLLGVLPLFAGADLILFAVRLLGPGAVAGALAVLFYALADDLREPILRQALIFALGRALRRHTYRKDTADAHTPRRADRERPAGASGTGGADGADGAPGRVARVGGADVARARAVFTAGASAARAALSPEGLAKRLPRRRSRDRRD